MTDLTFGEAQDAVRFTKIAKFAEENDALLSLDRVPEKGEGGKPEWIVSLIWGQEAEDSPMAGAASYGVGDTLAEALGQVYDELRLEERHG